MPINFVQSGKKLQLKTNSPQLNLHSQETKVDLKKQEGTIDFELVGGNNEKTEEK